MHPAQRVRCLSPSVLVPRQEKLHLFGILVFGATFALTSVAASLPAIYVLMLINGTLGGTVLPYIYTRIAELSSPKTSPLNNAIALIGSNISSFLSPYFGALLGGATVAANAVQNAGLLSVALSVIVFIVIAFARKYPKNNLA